MTNTFCVWCWSPIKVPATFNNKTDRAVCSRGCKDAEAMFNVQHSDEEINRRAHYRALTKGEDYGQEET